MELDTSLAPGCFGMSMCFREGSSECSTCPFATSCQPLAEQQLAMLRAELGVVVPEVKKAPLVEKLIATPSPALLALTDGLPKKVAAWVTYIEREGIKVTESLAAGENPFKGRRPQFLNVACHLLLKRPQGVDREILSQAFMRSLNWQSDTTASHVTQTKQILSAIGAIDDVDGLMRLRIS